jgi:hypothetical protein
MIISRNTGICAVFADADRKVPISADNMYLDLFATQKVITCTAVMHSLSAESWASWISWRIYLPEFGDVKVLDNGEPRARGRPYGLLIYEHAGRIDI